MSVIRSLKNWWGHSEDSDFVAAVRPHLDHLYRTAYRFSGSAEDAEDLVQDLLTKLYARRTELRDVDQLRPWLTRTLYRVFVDAKRKRLRTPLGHQVEMQSEADGDPWDGFAGSGPLPEEETELLITGARLRQALFTLRPEQRALLILHDAEGHTLQELETLLGTPLGTLKSRLHRARRQMRGLLQAEPFPAVERVNG